MAITNGYCTLAQLKAHIGETGSTDDTKLELVVQGVSRRIDAYTGRQFWVTSSEIRYYTPYTVRECIIDDITTSTPTVALDLSGTGTYTAITASDFMLTPFNADKGDVFPWSSIMMAPYGAYRFNPEIPKSVKVTATFGVPASSGWVDIVREACLIQCSRIFQRRHAPFGVAGATSQGDITLIDPLDPDVRDMLAPPVRRVVKPW
jgi:hypothetical protein